jgi:hypothetical protein
MSNPDTIAANRLPGVLYSESAKEQVLSLLGTFPFPAHSTPVKCRHFLNRDFAADPQLQAEPVPRSSSRARYRDCQYFEIADFPRCIDETVEHGEEQASVRDR